jgi:DNA-binding FadR family transcriptional regulator
MLTAKGLLTARPRQGTRVQPEENWNLLDPDVLRWMLEREFSLQLLIEFTEIRLAVEPAGAALAARSATPADRAAIARGIEQMLAAERGEADPLKTDIDFHAAILRASRNPFYSQLRELIETALRFSIRRTNANKGVPLASVLDHKRVADAILAGDARAAESAMREIIQEAMDLLLAEQEPRRPDKRSTA